MKLNNRMQALLLIIVGIIIGIVANKINLDDIHNEMKSVVSYGLYIISISLIIVGIREIFGKSD